MAPEVLLGKGYDHSVDMWSIGVIIYILVSGAHPFSQDDNDAALSDICNGRYSFPPARFDHVSPQAKNLIKRLLSVDPLLRPSANEALYHSWIQHGPLSADPSSS
eukprot:TRINITY_DN1892_c0_g1_i1.p2 TRINITY_DN1892_c0_g1~~TRINITY_DN1892_c0_g1_i1.p2  ORF type:complete len:105 (+),score=13.90 TRINITY_DN1892_c0_g1_i1:638-952(+)